jgi:NAD+ synthase (glutamine-hydrolysing)
MRILAAQLNPIIGDLEGNTHKILKAIATAKEHAIDIVLFSELVLTGYPPEDFLLLPHFMDSVEAHLKKIVEASSGITVILGTPRRNSDNMEKPLLNSAAIITDGKIVGYQDKILLPTYDVFDERRYFEPCKDSKIWMINGKRVGITICEDIWTDRDMIKYTSYLRDPVAELKPFKIDLMLNLSASPFSLGHLNNRLSACSRAAKMLRCPVILCNQVGGNDSLIFDGYSVYMGRDGYLSNYAPGYTEGYLLADLSQATGIREIQTNEPEEIYQALVLGLRDYFVKSGFKKACLGLSGGIDSALVACLAAEALGPENVLAVGMPSRYTSEESVTDAKKLVENLGIQYKEISIEQPFDAYLNLLKPEFAQKEADATEQNMQARIRGMILMALSNKFGYIVLSTGNKSELAMGYTTLYGDTCGGLAVISDVTKKQIYEVAKWINRDKEIIPHNILTKAPTAELKPNQKDQDDLPDYSIVDNVLEAYIEEHQSPEHIAERFHYELNLVKSLVKRMHANEYKRRQVPPGLRISDKAFSVGRRFPIVQGWL